METIDEFSASLLFPFLSNPRPVQYLHEFVRLNLSLQILLR